MLKNKYLHRTGARAGSAMVIRNGYPKQLGVQYYVVVEGESDEHFFENLLDLSKCKISNLKGKENRCSAYTCGHVFKIQKQKKRRIIC